jgi:hypothetical protein
MADFRNIALTKQIGDSTEDTLSWLMGQDKEWLLLIDNADDTKLNLRDYFPRCLYGNILITSRNRDSRLYAPGPESRAEVSGLMLDDAINLLFKVAGLEKDRTTEIEILATTLVNV